MFLQLPPILSQKHTDFLQTLLFFLQTPLFFSNLFPFFSKYPEFLQPPFFSPTYPDPLPRHEEQVAMAAAPHHPSPCVRLACTRSSCLNQVLCPLILPFFLRDTCISMSFHQHRHTWDGGGSSKSWTESKVSIRMVTLGTSYSLPFPSFSCVPPPLCLGLSPSFPGSPERAQRWAFTLTANLKCSGDVLEWSLGRTPYSQTEHVHTAHV